MSSAISSTDDISASTFSIGSNFALVPIDPISNIEFIDLDVCGYSLTFIIFATLFRNFYKDKYAVHEIFILILAIYYSQNSDYSTYDVVEKSVGEVESMNPEEIKLYNDLIKEGYSDTISVLAINTIRSQRNLIKAPATIVDYSFNRDENNKIRVMMSLINTTPKLIKNATFTFEFLNDYANVIYDINTGNSSLNIILVIWQVGQILQ